MLPDIQGLDTGGRCDLDVASIGRKEIRGTDWRDTTGAVEPLRAQRV